MMGLIEAGGWIGMVMVLGAYIAVSSGRLAPVSFPACMLNSVGSTCLAISAATSANWAIFTLNAIWALVGAWGLMKVLRPKPRPEN
jgi:integral membrane sensor domain MASE1